MRILSGPFVDNQAAFSLQDLIRGYSLVSPSLESREATGLMDCKKSPRLKCSQRLLQDKD